jgi:acetyl esterase
MPVDPAIARLLRTLALAAPHDGGFADAAPPLPAPPLPAQRRAAFRGLMQLSETGSRVAATEDRTVPGPGGPLAVRLYAPPDEAAGPRPGVVFLHGGGYVSGDLETHDPLCRALCAASGCRLVAVDYRLAPEHPFPAAVEDAHAATLWVLDHAAALGLDGTRIGIAGDSAGATLAAAVCRRLVRTRPGALALQVLLCPILDWVAETDSRRAFARGYLLDSDVLARELADYLAGQDAADPEVSPLRAPDLHGHPQTHIHTAEYDPLRDEGDAYADKLRRAGVAVRHTCHPGMVHLFYGFGRVVPYARTALAQIGGEIRAALAG